MNTLSLLLYLQLAYILAQGEDHDRSRRDLSMLRMGKRDIGLLSRSLNLPPLVPPSEDMEERGLVIPEQVWVPRMGKHLSYPSYPAGLRLSRAPPFPRYGKTFEDLLNEYRRELGDEEVRQLYLQVPRVGRSKRSAELTNDDEVVEGQEYASEKRAAPFPRLGLREENEVMSEEERASPFPRLGLYERAAPFPRLGLRDQEERAMAFPRLGLRDFEDADENELESKVRAAPFPRLGLRDQGERASPFPRLGYRDMDSLPAAESEKDKKAMGMLRMGKRGMSMLRMGKRPVSMLRMGRSQSVADDAEKRAMGMLRMGRSDAQEKRGMSMLRMGKRAMGMLRMGRSDNSAPEEEEKRAMGMLRMGRALDNMEEEAEAAADKRAMSMLRMGKRPMSMLRMGKRPVSMLRMGKRDVDDVQEDNNSELSSNKDKKLNMLRLGRSADSASDSSSVAAEESESTN